MKRRRIEFAVDWCSWGLPFKFDVMHWHLEHGDGCELEYRVQFAFLFLNVFIWRLFETK